MKIDIHSLTFKTLSISIVSSVGFIFFIALSVEYTFSKGYEKLIEEKISIIENNIIPSLSLNLSFGFLQAINELGEKTLKNSDILFLKIQSDSLKKEIVFSKCDIKLEKYKKSGEFISTAQLIDPTTNDTIGNIILVYSKKSYDKYMQDFYPLFLSGIFLFGLSTLFISLFLYNSLKHLGVLSDALKSFNPSNPKKLLLNISSKDEIGSIASSANKMVDNLIQFLNTTKVLNTELSLKESHLKDAQRIAKVGSWEYNISDNILSVSDEVYRMIGMKQSDILSWRDFTKLISKKDRKYVGNTLKNAMKNGSLFNIKYSIITHKNTVIDIHTKGKVRKKEDGSARMTGVSMDITQDVKNKKIIEKLAYYDSLTGLANRLLLKDRIHKAIQTASREKLKIAIIFLDLDHFKLINDTLGHSVGDELLIYISKVLKDQIREADTLSRLGGDEFVILLPSVRSNQDAIHIASKIQTALQKKHDIGAHQLYVTSSIGVSIYPEHGETSEELIRNSDTAMYEAKNHGRNSYKIYSKSMGNYVDKQLHLEQDLIQAVKNKTEIEVFYQPKIDSKTNFISGAEALVRWRHPTKGLIFPDDFIYIAESTGLMIELGNIIIEESIFQVQEWSRLGLGGLKVAINLSARQFQDSSLVSFIASMIYKYQIDPSQVEFEITETISMTNMTNTLRILTQLRDIGISIAIDDFGTGHSSLSYLKKFPINTLKIDKSFVIDILEDEEDIIIVQTIVSMAHSLGLNTVAEGVETFEHVEILKKLKCDQLQGYYFSKALPKDDFTKFLQNYTPN